MLTNDDGDLAGTASYSEYGQPEGTTGAASPFGYAGQYTDPETGYQYLRAHYYDPATGEFLTRDPLEALTQAPYRYADNNPTNATDPLGLWPWDGACLQNPFGENDRCDSIAEQHPEGAQQVADFAGGALDTVTGGNANLILANLPGDQSGKTHEGTNAHALGRIAGFAVAIANPAAFANSTTYGGVVNMLRTSSKCMTGSGGPNCGADIAGAATYLMLPLGLGRAGRILAPDFALGTSVLGGIFGAAIQNTIDAFQRFSCQSTSH